VFNLPNSGGVLHTFALLPKPNRSSFTPGRVIWGSLGGDQSPLLPLKTRPIIQTQVLISLTGGAPLLSLVPAPHGFHCSSEGFTLTHWENECLLRIKLSVDTWWDLLPVVWGCILVTREVTNHHVHNPGSESPRNVTGISS
jgi:hypothetical protein